MDTQCVLGLKALVELCCEDAAVARFVFNMPAPSMQFARYTDWFFPYAEQLKESTLNQVKNTTTMLEYHKSRLVMLDRILELRPQLEALFERWIEEQKSKLAQMGPEEFKGYTEQCLYPAVPDVITSYPPAYLVGPTTSDTPRVLMTQETELATITLEEVNCEYMYSNPQGLFNLSVPEKMWRNQVNY